MRLRRLLGFKTTVLRRALHAGVAFCLAGIVPYAAAAQLGPLQIFSTQGQPFSSQLMFAADAKELPETLLEIINIECGQERCPKLTLDGDNIANPAAPRMVARRIVSAEPVASAAFAIQIKLTSPTQVMVRAYRVTLDQPLLAPPPAAPSRRALAQSEEGAKNLRPPTIAASRTTSETDALSSPENNASAPGADALTPQGEARTSEIVAKVDLHRRGVGDNATEQVLTAIQDWAKAWSQRDVDRYLGFYAESFTPSDGSSRAVWAAKRRERLRAPSEIRVSLENVNVITQSDIQIVVQFRQDYNAVRGDRKQRMQVRKQLIFERTNSGWLITSEEVQPGRPMQ